MKKLSLLLAIGYQLLALSHKTEAQTGIITTISGNGIAAYNGDSIQATAAEITQVEGIGMDTAGNIYFADSQNSRIRKIATTGIITTVAGNGVGAYSGDGGQATNAELYNPTGLAVDSLGDIYIADYGNYIIRMVNTSGIISTIAGIPNTSGFSGDGGQATAAELNQCYAVALDKNLNVYFSDVSNSDVREITMSTGIITTVAGNRIAGFSGNGGQATNAELESPVGIAIDKAGDIYICDGNNEVRMVNTSGVITAFAGTGVYGYNGSYGLATTIDLASPQGIAVSSTGNIYITDLNYSLVWEVIPSSNQIYAIGGNHVSGFSGDGGLATYAKVSCPFPVLLDKSNNIYIGDDCNYRFRKITAGCFDTANTNVVTSPQCNGNTNGELIASNTSPFYPYIYSWSDGNTNQSDSGLAAGTYTISISDVFGCTGTGAVTITQPAALSVTADSTIDLGFCNGSAWAIVNGGTTPYSYLWTGGLTTDTIINQCSGNYCCTITDANGCLDSVCTTIEIFEGTNGVKGESQNVKVYPNPNNGSFTIQWSVVSSQSSDVQLSIINELGQVVYSENNPVGIGTIGTKGTYTEQLNLSNLASGIYTLRMESNSGIAVKKLVIMQR